LGARNEKVKKKAVKKREKTRDHNHRGGTSLKVNKPGKKKKVKAKGGKESKESRKRSKKGVYTPRERGGKSQKPRC